MPNFWQLAIVSISFEALLHIDAIVQDTRVIALIAVGVGETGHVGRVQVDFPFWMSTVVTVIPLASLNGNPLIHHLVIELVIVVHHIYLG